MPLLDPKLMGEYARYSQLGLEMVAPIALGYLLDAYVFDSVPWFTAGGAVMGLTWAVWRLSRLLDRGS